MIVAPPCGGLRVFKVWQFPFSWTAWWARKCFVCTVHVQDVHSGIVCRMRKIHSRVLSKVGALDSPRGSSGWGSSSHSLWVPFLVGELRSLKLRRPKKKKGACRAGLQISCLLPPHLMLLVAMKSCYFSFRPRVSSYLENKPKNPMSCTLLCSAQQHAPTVFLMMVVTEILGKGNCSSFFYSFLEAASIFHFPTLTPSLSCHVWFASSSAHNTFAIIFKFVENSFWGI